MVFFFWWNGQRECGSYFSRGNTRIGPRNRKRTFFRFVHTHFTHHLSVSQLKPSTENQLVNKEILKRSQKLSTNNNNKTHKLALIHKSNTIIINTNSPNRWIVIIVKQNIDSLLLCIDYEIVSVTTDTNKKNTFDFTLFISRSVFFSFGFGKKSHVIILYVLSVMFMHVDAKNRP